MDRRIRIMRIADVMEMVGLSRATIWRRINHRQFPAPLKLGGPRSRAVGWREADVVQWIEEREEVGATV